MEGLVKRQARAQVEEIDWSVGSVLGALRNLGVAENTLVVFTSDNGRPWGTVNAPLRGGKGSTWEGGMRVPTLAWWPGTIPAGSSSDEIASSMDLLPTFARLAGSSVPDDRVLGGRDISDFPLGWPNARSLDETFLYYNGHDLEGVRSGKWKLLRESG